MSGIILYADPHFSNRKAWAVTLQHPEFPGCNSRFHEIVSTFRAAVDYGVRHGAEGFFVLGDIFHERGILAVPVLNAVYKVLHDTARTLPLYLFPGNHDFVDLRAMHADKNLHSLLLYEKSINLVDTPRNILLDDFSISIVPYNPEAEQTIEAASRLCQKTPRLSVLMLHHSIAGATTGPHEWVMASPLEANDLPAGYDLTFSGHYHQHQKVGKAYYVGAPLHHDFGEVNYIPGFIHLLADGTWKHIENTISPRFRVIEATSLSDIPEDAKKDYVSVIWSGEEDVVLKVKQQLPMSKVEIKQATVVTLRTTIDKVDSTEDMFKKYVVSKRGEDYSSALYDKGVSLFRGTA